MSESENVTINHIDSGIASKLVTLKAVANDYETDNDPLSDSNLSALMRENIKYLRPYLRLDGVTDLHINKPCEIIIKHSSGKREKVQDHNLTKQWLNGLCILQANISGQKYNEYSHPLLGFKLAGGHRVQVISGSIVPDITIAIRVNRQKKYELSSFNLTNKEQLIVKNAIKNKKTILVSGGTGSGKTSFINSLIPLIDLNERIITIEDVEELQVPHDNKVSLIYSSSDTAISGLKSSNLFNASLRLDPDRIIVGEIRQNNATTFFNAINSGHEGSVATIHANNPDEALNKVCDYMIMNGDISASGTETAIKRLRNNIAVVVQLYNSYGEERRAEVKEFR